jgi:hypothetical protein
MMLLGTRVGRLRGRGRRVRGEAQEGNVCALLPSNVSSRAILIRGSLNCPFCRLRLNSVAQRSAVFVVMRKSTVYRYKIY